MPQIKVNEIDQSIYTRVVTDDKVRVMVPGIASFGPSVPVDADLTDLSGVTFTDVTDFEKVFGYTEPEYNPFKNDVSRIYAKQLIKHGAAVTFIKINNGTQADYNIGFGENDDRTIPSAAAVVECEYTLLTKKPANWDTAYATYYKATFTLLASEPAKWELEFNNYYTVDAFGVYHQVLGNTVPEFVTNKYYSGAFASVANASDWADNLCYKKNADYNADIHKFAPQIDSIEAKYAGSFGNRLLVTFTPVTSKNRNFTYQYSMVTVYRADIVVESSKLTNGTISVTPRITGVHKLESHIVTTNPDDANYFANVEFAYIKIAPTVTAYDELSLIWSDMSADPESGVTVYSGFPEIPLRYTDDSGNTKFNEYALLYNGLDFNFDDTELVENLAKGFGGFSVDGTTGKVTVENINKWIWACYKPDGIVTTTTESLINCYANYTDPYVYDFDFITSGGFINETYSITDSEGTPITTQAEAEAATEVLIAKSDRDDVPLPTGVTPIHKAMQDLVETRQDCIALFDINPYWDKASLPLYVNSINTSYGAFHAPWCYCNNPDEIGTVLMPPSFVFLYTMLSNLINNTDAQKWFPPAGVTRATARVVVKPLYEIGSVLLDKWENNTLARINPIMKLKNYGYVIYGQYTAYVAQDEYTHSALESLNVRLISNCVKKQIFNTCLKLAFEPNNSSLWIKFYDSMDKYLLFMKRNDGVYDYRIQMDEGTVTTDDINELRCPGKVWINPVRTAEFFDIDFILTDAGVTFTDTVEEGV